MLTPIELIQATVDAMAARGFGRLASRALWPGWRAVCAFMCSVHAGDLTGQNVLVDGGTYPGTF